MEKLYESLISGSDLLAEQFMGAIFDLVNPEGPVLIYVSPDYAAKASHPVRAGFLHSNPGAVTAICGRIDDGDDPCVLDVDGGCVVATQLATEQGHFGYFMVFFQGYDSDIVQTNMDMTELLLAQGQLVCRLIEKNNRLHQTQLMNLSKRSSLLGDVLAVGR